MNTSKSTKTVQQSVQKLQKLRFGTCLVSPGLEGMFPLSEYLSCVFKDGERFYASPGGVLTSSPPTTGHTLFDKEGKV